MLDRLVADWPLKLLALALAFVLWGAITGEESIRRDFDVALDPQLREDQVVAGPLRTRVTVRLEGPSSVIRGIDELKLAVRPDLSDKLPGTREIQLVDSHLVGKPARASIRFFEPDRVSLVLDELVNRRLPVTPNLVGRPLEGHEIYGVWTHPESVVVEGPAIQVEAMDSVTTEPVHVEGLTQSIIQSVEAISGQPQVRIIEPVVREYEVRVEIDAAPVERRLEGLPVHAAPAGSAARFSPPEVTVVLSGPPALVDAITPAQVRVTADVAELVRPTQVTPMVELELSPEQTSRVAVASVKPQRVSARPLGREQGS
jgi:hypothetical protein